jgi:hypothetical protein
LLKEALSSLIVYPCKKERRTLSLSGLG